MNDYFTNSHGYLTNSPDWMRAYCDDCHRVMTVFTYARPPFVCWECKCEKIQKNFAINELFYLNHND
jgi:ribosomal protein S27E